MEFLQHRIGYACMNGDIEPSTYKTCRIASLSDSKLVSLIRHNLDVLEAAIDYNIKHDIRLFRISSNIIPFGSHPLNTLDWAEAFEFKFAAIREKIATSGMRVSMHPGQYTVINSPDPNVVTRSLQELDYHAKVLDLLTTNDTHKMILHVGGVYDDKAAAMDRFCTVYKKWVSRRVRARLVIENDETSYTVSDVLSIAHRTRIPVVFDNLHHTLNPSLESRSIDEIMHLVMRTWAPKDGSPKVHYSQQDPNKRHGAHSETIDLVQFNKDYHQMYARTDVDIMLEVKDKNRSCIKVMLFMEPRQTRLEAEWARYKYWVMARSQQAYNELRTLFKSNTSVDPLSFYTIIDRVSTQNKSLGSEINAIEHVWGYFKNKATDKEKDHYKKLLVAVQLGEKKPSVMTSYLYKLARLYDVTYLTESYYFK